MVHGVSLSFSSFKWPMMVNNLLRFVIKQVKSCKRPLSTSCLRHPLKQEIPNRIFPHFPSTAIVLYVSSSKISQQRLLDGRHFSLVSNSSQTVTTVRTSSSIDLQQQSKDRRLLRPAVQDDCSISNSDVDQWHDDDDHSTIERDCSSSDEFIRLPNDHEWQSCASLREERLSRWRSLLGTDCSESQPTSPSIEQVEQR